MEIYKIIDQVLEMEKYEILTPYINGIEEEDFLDLAPETLIEYVKSQDPKLLVLIMSFVKRVYFTHPTIFQDDDEKVIALGYRGKIQTSIGKSSPKKLSLQFLHYSINDNLKDMYSLVFLDLSYNGLQTSDLPLLQKLITQFPGIKAINLDANSIYCESAIDEIKALFAGTGTMINFINNYYSYYQGKVLKAMYATEASAKGYVWLLPESSWGEKYEKLKNKLDGLEVLDHIDQIVETHLRYYEIINKYS